MMKSRKVKIISVVIFSVFVYFCIMTAVVSIKSNSKNYVGIEDNGAYFGMTDKQWIDTCTDEDISKHISAMEVGYYSYETQLFSNDVMAECVFFYENNKFKLCEVTYIFDNLNYDGAKEILAKVNKKLSEQYVNNKYYVWNSDSDDGKSRFSYSFDIQNYDKIISYDVKFENEQLQIDGRRLKISWFS